MQPWITAADVFDCQPCTEDLLTVASDAQVGLAMQIASETLHAMSGRQFGLWGLTVRPVCASNLPVNRRGSWSAASYPLVDFIDGQWFNLGISGHESPCLVWQCGTGRVPTLDLGVKYVDSVASVVIEGEALDASAYRLDSHRYLIRLDGGMWPTHQDLTVSPADPGGWSVSYLAGRTPNASGRNAAAELACQLLIRMCGDRTKCLIPDRVTRQVRNGVSVNSTDLLEIIRKGGTGLTECEMFINQTNPERLAAPPRLSLPRHSRRY